MTSPPSWKITITVRAAPPEDIRWLARALGPELAREVPRASASLVTPEAQTLRVEVLARDTGAARAATNTYLGWIHLAQETMRRARSAA